MTAEEYIVERLTKTEKELADQKFAFAELNEKMKKLISENGRLGDQLGFLAEVMNPRVKIYGGSRSIVCTDVSDWMQDGEKKVDRMIEIFGLANDDDIG